MAQFAQRVLLMVHPHFRPDRAGRSAGTEADIWRTLQRIGYKTELVSAREDLHAFAQTVERFRPHVVFNLLEEFRGEAVFDFHLISYLEARGIAFTGCNPRGLILSRNKFLVSQIAASHGLRVPRSWLLAPGEMKIAQDCEFPLFVKLNREHASLGIREANRVKDRNQLNQVCRRMREDFASEILVQQFIAGRDISFSVWGNSRVQVFSPRQLHMGSVDRISTERLKFNLAQQKRRGLRTSEFKSSLVKGLQKEVKRLYRRLDMSGYARFDFRLSEENVAYLIDVNANPNLAIGEDFSLSARSAGLNYTEVVDRIVKMARVYRPRT